MLTLSEIESEIARVKSAMAKSKSKYFIRDSNKYLKRLYNMRRRAQNNAEIDRLLEVLNGTTETQSI